jgi:RNA recognition motif 2
MSPTSLGIAPVQQIFGLSLEAAPFSLSIESN